MTTHLLFLGFRLGYGELLKMLLYNHPGMPQELIPWFKKEVSKETLQKCCDLGTKSDKIGPFTPEEVEEKIFASGMVHFAELPARSLTRAPSRITLESIVCNSPQKDYYLLGSPLVVSEPHQKPFLIEHDPPTLIQWIQEVETTSRNLLPPDLNPPFSIWSYSPCPCLECQKHILTKHGISAFS